MNAYLYIIIWIFILFIICEILQHQEYKELEKKYFESKETIEILLRKLADARTDLKQIEKQLEIKEQECLEANRIIKYLKEDSHGYSSQCSTKRDQ